MIDSDEIKTSAAQEDDVGRFIDAIMNYIKNSIRSNSDHSHFKKKIVDSTTTSQELYHLLQQLMSEKGRKQRQAKHVSNADHGGCAYMSSTEGRLLKDLIKVHGHDHNGIMWTQIIFEPLHAKKLAELATKLYPDCKVQLEMDFL